MRTSRLRPIRRGIVGGIVALFVLAIGTGAVLGVSIGTSLDRTGEVVVHADALAANAAKLRAALIDQETGVRGYQLTADDAFLQPYRNGLRAEQGALDDLAVASANETLTLATREVTRAAETWRATWVVPQLALMADGEAEAARAAVATGEGRRLFDQIRGALGRVDLAVTDIRATALAALDQTEQFLDGVIALAVLGYGLALVIGAYWVITRIGRPLDQLVHTAEAMERGEAVRFTGRRQDEIGTLARTIERLHETVQHRYQTAAAMADQSTTLNRLSELVSYADDDDAVVRAGTAALERLIPSRGGEVLFVNPSFDQLRIASVWGDVTTPAGRPLAIDRPNACPGIRRNAVHVTRSALDAFSLTCEIHPLRFGSLLCVPMISHNEVIGVIHLEREDEDAFDEDDTRIAGRVAEQVALAMANLRLMRRMEQQAMTDPLTGLSNPRAFDPLVERELAVARREGQSLALIMLDLDHFKHFNDTHGHPAGDEALRAFARTVRGSLRETDVAARYGGEEFAILLRNTDLDGAALVADKVRAAIELTPIEIGPNRFARITASLGVAASDRHGEDRMQLMRLADAALYEAKHGGRNRIALAPAAERRERSGADDEKRPSPIRGRIRRQRRESGTG